MHIYEWQILESKMKRNKLKMTRPKMKTEDSAKRKQVYLFFIKMVSCFENHTAAILPFFHHQRVHLDILPRVSTLRCAQSVARDAMHPVSMSICSLISTRPWQSPTSFHIIYETQQMWVGCNDSGRLVAGYEPQCLHCLPCCRKEWEPLKRPGRAYASICLHALQWSPAHTTWDYTHVQAVTVICIGS